MNLGEIEKLTKNFADARSELSGRVRALEDEISQIKKRHLAGIKRSVAQVTEKQHLLKTALEAGRALFVKPKTMILHGIKIGFVKAKGKLQWEKDEQVVKLIKKHFPEQADVLIITTEKPAKDALQQLSAADLKKLGITVEDTGDKPVIKSTDSEIDKFIDALLKDDDQAGDKEAA